MSQKRRGANNPEDPKTETTSQPEPEVTTEVEPEVTTEAETETVVFATSEAVKTEAGTEANVAISVTQVDGVQFVTEEDLINAMGDQSALAKANAVITSSACSVCGYEPRYNPYGARVCPADSAECPIL